MRFSPNSHLPILVELIVGELDLLEGDDLLPQLLSSVRGVRMNIKPMRRWRICLPCYQPR